MERPVKIMWFDNNNIYIYTLYIKLRKIHLKLPPPVIF